MKLTAERPFAYIEAAARKLVEIAGSIEPVQDCRVDIENHSSTRSRPPGGIRRRHQACTNAASQSARERDYVRLLRGGEDPLGAFVFLVLQQRKKPLSVLLALPLVIAHYFQFGLGAACILMLPFKVNDQRLLLRQPSLSFNDIALQLSQLIEKCIVKHHSNAPSSRT
jgi:hypothetical protein